MDQDVAVERWSLTHRATSWSSDESVMAVIFNPVQLNMESLFIEAADVARLAVIDVRQNSLLHLQPREGTKQALFLQDNQTLAVGRTGATSQVDFLRISDLQQTGSWQLGAAPVTAMCEDAAHHILACGTGDGHLWLWDTQRQEPLVHFELMTEPVQSLAFSEDGTILRAGTYTGIMELNLTPAADRVRHYIGESAHTR